MSNLAPCLISMEDGVVLMKLCAHVLNSSKGQLIQENLLLIDMMDF